MDQMEAEDVDVVARARNGDIEAFRALVQRHSRGLFHLAYRLTGNEQDAEDVVQETFMRAHRQLDRFESRAGFGTWLHRIAANCAIDLTRSRRRRVQLREVSGREASGDPVEQLPADGPSQETLVFRSEVRQRVGDALDHLTSSERAAFVLRHFEEKSIEEIRTTLGLSENAAKQSIFRAVRKLRKALGPVMSPAR